MISPSKYEFLRKRFEDEADAAKGDAAKLQKIAEALTSLTWSYWQRANEKGLTP